MPRGIDCTQNENMLSQKITVTYAIATISLAAAGCAGTVDVASDNVAVGDQTVELRTWTGGPGHWFVNLHDDENTSVDAALWYIRKRGGRVIELAHDGTRNVTFGLGSTKHAVDPNRIYTDAGRAATLESLSEYSEAANEATKALSDAVVGRINDANPTWVVALHNNTDESYSLKSYLPEGPYLGDARAVHHGFDMDPDDFYFVTDEKLYRALAMKNLNVVLQNNDGVTDDGSLSVYCARAGIRYVNVEAQHGHERTQRRMIVRLLRALPDLEP